MSLRRVLVAVAAAAAVTSSAAAQEVVPAPVEVAPLAAPDAFSAGTRDTGLGQDLWRGASAETLNTVLPLLASKPLSPAAQALARRVLATGAPGPEALGPDAAGMRAAALIGVGAARDAAQLLARASGLDQTPSLAQAAAESALLAGDDERACKVGDQLAVGRENIYWLRLRAFCQQRAGNSGAAQLTFDLAQSQARDAIYGRLMGAKLAGAGSPGAASLRNGLDYALSRSLGLDLSAAQPAPAVAAALASGDMGAATWKVEGGPGPVQAAMASIASGDLAGAQSLRAGLTQDSIPGATITDLALLDAMLAAAAGRADGPTLDRLVERGAAGEPKAVARAQSAALVFAALGAPMGPTARGQFARFAAGEAKAPAARALALDLAGEQKLAGETAMLALWISADAGAVGPAPGDRARIVRALRAAGLDADARAYAVEGLLALR